MVKNMISHKHKAIFIHIPKTAGSSIEKALINSEAGFRLFRAEDFTVDQIPLHAFGYQGVNQWDLKHMPARYLKPEYNDYYKFCFIRNPWDLMVSCYFWWTQKVKLPIRIKQGEILKTIGFENFVYSFYTDYINEIHHQGLGQSYWLLDSSNKTAIVDFIGRFERLQEDFNFACDKVGISKLQLYKVNKSEHKIFESYYNEQTAKMIRNKFYLDVTTFNYFFDDRIIVPNFE
jgi:hypothetical protein